MHKALIEKALTASAINRMEDLKAEDALAWQLQHTLPQVTVERQARILLPRLFQVDFWFPIFKLAVEVDGGGWINGRHSRGQGIENDCEKSALIAALPARLMRVTPKQIKDGRALQWIERSLAA